MVSRLVSSTPLTDLNIGGVFTTMLEAAAQEDDEQYFQMLEIIRGYSLDTTTGSDLDARAFEYSLTRLAAQRASTTVNIGDSAITKVSTNAYSGLPGSAAGTMSINANVLTGFPSTGSIVVGRGTPRTETVAYSSITNNTTYVTFNLSTAFAYDHGTDETIILSQGGNRLVTAGTVVKVPASDINPEISYTLNAAATILDGEHEVDSVPVTASVAGSSANVPIGSIIAFDSLPFSTATVTNPTRVTNGADLETDQALRDRIKSTIQSLSRGTGTSIITGVQNVSANNRRVVSASLVEPTVPADVVKVFIDDGTGFIPTFADVGVETIVQSATGGEKFLFALNVPLVKAFVESQNSSPYNLVGGETLFVEVGGQVETITFASTDFRTPGAATAQEVLKKINGTANSFECRVTNAGAQIKIFSRSNTNEQIQVTGGTANAVLNFPTDLKYTAKLYRVRDSISKLLTKDGITAALDCVNSASYNMSTEKNLVVVVDGIASQPQMVWFQPTDFVTPTNVTAGQIVGLLNLRLSGAVAEQSSNNTKVRLTSNTPLSSSSQLRVVETFTTAFRDSGTFTNITSSLPTGAVISGNTTDHLYLGHDTIPFESIYASNTSGTSGATWQFWNGSAWASFTPFDETSGLSATGHILFRLPPTWVPNAVSGVTAYWVRATNITAGSARLRVCSANLVFGFPETPSIGANKDYTLNRFIGQIELVETLNAGDQLTIGSFDTRAAVVSTTGTFGLFGGESLNVTVDGVAQSVSFSAPDFSLPGAASPTEVVARINKDLNGATAFVVAAGTIVKLQTNTLNGGTLQVTGGTANPVLNFPTTLQTSFIAHEPALTSAAEPYAFNPDSSLIVVMDGNAANNFTTPTTKASTLTGASSTTSVADTSLYPIFPLATDLTGFDFLYTQSYFAIIQAIQYRSSVADKKYVNIAYTAGGIAGAEVVTVLGDSISISIANGVSTANQIKAAFDAKAAATALASATLISSGAATQTTTSPIYLLAPRVQVASYAIPSGAMTLSSPLPVAPSVGDSYQLAPRTAAQVVKFWSNKKVALLTTQAEVRTANGGTEVQIASLQAGELASVQVPGGDANVQLQYSTSTLLGVDGYRYYTDLAQVAQWTIDGRVSDPATYPGIRAAGVQVEVAEPVTVPITASLTITTQEGITLSAISNDIKSAVASYINSLTVGAEVVVSSITATVKAVNGVFDVKVNSPSANIAIAFNELARIKESDIIVG